MIEHLAQALERLREAPAGSEEIVAIAVEVPVVSTARLVSTHQTELPLSVWDAMPRAGDEPVAVVGFGEAVRVDGHGVDRFAQVSAAARKVFSALRRQCPADVDSASGPYFVGGLSFRPKANHGPWSEFADASFTLPRWSYIRRGGKAWLWLCARSDELVRERSAIQSEADKLAAAIVLAGQTPRDVGASRPAAVVAQFDVADRDAYCALVADAIACIQSRVAEKIVAVASSRVTFADAVDPRVVFERLDSAYSDTTRFAIQRGERLFVGASPERLVAVRGRRVDSDALAGTARRGVDDEAIKQALLSSEKDLREHAFVVESIATLLGEHCTSLEVEDKPCIRSLRNVHHLWTAVRGVLRDETHVLSLVESLHPTPAVAGTPRDRATAWIVEHEPTSRGWYTGAVGYFDAAGNGEFAVAIRAGLVGRDAAFLYAGAGIVAASDPSSEYAETRAKEAPMLAALGIAP